MERGGPEPCDGCGSEELQAVSCESTLSDNDARGAATGSIASASAETPNQRQTLAELVILRREDPQSGIENRNVAPLSTFPWADISPPCRLTMR